MNKKYTVEQFLKDLMNLQDDNSDEALELSYKACDLLIDSHGMLIHENVIYLRKHDVVCHVGESDSYGILTLILRWPDLCGHLHEMLVG
jgi:hypothetical protein